MDRATKAKARAQAQRALKQGVITKRPCNRCGSVDRLEMHHADYAKPLEIEWLCDPCHSKEHQIVYGGRCPDCGSTQVYYRFKTDDWNCRKCGTRFSEAQVTLQTKKGE